MSSLDDPASLRDADSLDMLGAFASTPAQLTASFESGASLEVPPAALARSLVFCAMGGSAAAGDVVSAAYRHAVDVPMVTVRDYQLPAFCDPSSLVICCSYSGNTEETLAAYADAVGRGCRVVVVASGGELIERARSDRLPAVEVPSDVPMPRAGLGYLVGGILGALQGLDVLEARDHLAGAVGVLEAVMEEIAPDSPRRSNAAKETAAWIGERIPLVWGSEGVSAAAAWRWKCALNENAKTPAFAATLPELDHHEVVGWAEGHRPGFVVLALREEGEHPSVVRRLEATRAELPELPWRHVHARGASPLSRVLSLMLLGDVTSTYLGLAKGLDPGPIDSLSRIKDRLREGRG